MSVPYLADIAPSDMTRAVGTAPQNATDPETLAKALRDAHRLRSEFGWPQEHVDQYVREQTGLPSTTALAAAITAAHPDIAEAPGVGASATVGFGKGASFGFLDRLAGALDALSVVQLGRPDLAPVAYRGGREESRAYYERAKAAHPIATGGGEVAGTLASSMIPGTRAAQVGRVTLPAAALRGALASAGAAGVSTLGYEPDLTDPTAYLRAGKAAAITAPFGALFGAGGQVLANRVAGRAPAVLESAIERSGGVPALRTAEGRMVAAGRGGSMVPADLHPALQEIADFAATNARPETRAGLEVSMAARRAGQPQRLAEDLRAIYGKNLDAAGRQGDLKALLRQIENDPQLGYRAINTVIEDPKLEEFLSRPIVANAYQTALRHLGAQGIEDVRPTFQTLNGVRRTLKSMATAAYRAGRGDRGAALQTASNELRDLIAKNVPEFDALQARVATVKGQIDAANLAEQTLRSETPMGLARKVNSLAPGQLDDFRYGIASRLYEQLASARTGRGVAKTLMEDPGLQAKLEVAFGDQTKFQNFMQRVAAERAQEGTNAAFGGSATGARIAAKELHAGSAMHGGVAITPRGPHPYLFTPLLHGAPVKTAEPLASALFTPQKLDELLAGLRAMKARTAPFRAASAATPGLFAGLYNTLRP